MQTAIAFSDGFDGDTAVIRVDGAEVWRADDLTTRTQISHAGMAELDVPEGSTVEVELPDHGLRTAVEQRPNVVVALMEGELQVSYPEQIIFA